jgi:hypothetical protein
MATISWAATLSSTKPGLREKVEAGAEGEDPAVVAAVEAGAEDEDPAAAAVAVVVVAEAGTVTAVIAAAEAAETAAGNSLQQSKVARKPGSLEAPRFYFRIARDRVMLHAFRRVFQCQLYTSEMCPKTYMKPSANEREPIAARLLRKSSRCSKKTFPQQRNSGPDRGCSAGS